MIVRIAAYLVIVLLAVALACATWAGRTTAQADEPSIPAPAPDARARTLFMQYCQSCHEGGRTNFDFDLASLEPDQINRHRATWTLALRKLRDHKMPPRRSTQPAGEEREAMAKFLEESLSANAPPSEPWRLRRLRRSEYLNVIRDLFDTSATPSVDLPADELTWTAGHNIPSLAPDHQQHYRAAAKSILDAVLGQPSLDSAGDSEPDDEFDSASDAVLPEDRSGFREILKNLDEESAPTFLASFARRAYGGPVDELESKRIVKVYENSLQEGETIATSVAQAIEEIMVSPRFLYRVEPSEDIMESSNSVCSEFELASRLAFFLWNARPDQELLDLAAAGTLRTHLDDQIPRMLRDPRSKALARDFASYWLGLDKLDSAPVNESLRRAMKKETRLFIRTILREDRSGLDFLSGDFTYVNGPLAKHYGITGIEGERFRRISLKGTGRRGLTTQASILTLTTKTDRTSPAIRGKWVLETFLGESIGDPPAEVMNDPNRSVNMQNNLAKTPVCAQCHAKMDPIGATLENFDAFGRWRAQVDNSPVRPDGYLPDGQVLHGAEQLSDYLMKHQDVFVRKLSERLLRFAAGRNLSQRDRADLDGVVEATSANKHRISDVILHVVQTSAFQRGSISGDALR